MKQLNLICICRFFKWIALSVLVSCASSCTNPENGEHGHQDSLKVDSIEAVKPIPRDSFLGVDIHDLDVQQGVFPNNQILGKFLLQYGLTSQQIHRLSEKSKPIFDVRKIRGGNKYHIIQTRDSVPVTKNFIYEVNPTEYIIYTIEGDSVAVRKLQKTMIYRERIVSGEIETSLWNSVVGQGVPFDLALKMSNIYAWNIDFFGLQKGDKYRVQYVEVLCDDSSFVRIDTIKTACFTHCGTEFWAIPFCQDGRTDYYDAEGNSLRKAFLKAPLSYSRISSYFTHKRFHPVLKYYRPHHGVDYAAPKGTPVSTIGDGRVTYKGWTKGGGNTVKIQHNSIYTTSYMHLSKFGKISVGSMVRQGEIIGYVGSTGVSTGPHLDFRVYQNGTPVNPLTIKSPPVEPVADSNRVAFFAIRDSLQKILK